MNFALMVARLRIGGRLMTSLAAASAVLVILCANPAARAASVQPLEIVTKSGVQVFSVEMATTEEEKQTGLMYRKELPDGKGMLFDFSPEQQISMWMKNTYISLDMIFIRADGRILRIAENTEPLSTKIISSGGLGQGRAGSDRGHGAKIWNSARRPGGAPAVQQALSPDRRDRLDGRGLSVYRRISQHRIGV